MADCPYCNKKLTGDERWCHHCENNISKITEKGNKPKCFIATAAYGSPFIFEVQVLRNFRDEILEKNIFGIALIKLYYLTSPPIAKIIEKNEFLKKIIRTCLSPVVKLIIGLRKRK